VGASGRLGRYLLVGGGGGEVIMAGSARLQASLRSRLGPAMTERGWESDLVAESMMGTAMIGAFRRQVGGEFSVTACFELDIDLRKLASQDASIKVMSDFGVSYDRSYRLWPLVSRYPSPSDLGLDDAEIFGPGKKLEATVRSDAEVDAIADKLAAESERAFNVAGRYASVDAILEQFHASHEIDQIYAMPLLLAAAGRDEEARASIVEYRSLQIPDTHDSEYRAFVTRLSDWIGSGSQLPDLPGPVTKVQTGEWADPDVEDLLARLRERPPRPQFREAWKRSRERGAKSRAANDAVRANKKGKSRGELAEMLQRERSKRGLDTNSRIVDILVDGIQADSRAEKNAIGLRAVKTYASWVKATFREIDATGNAAPAWMEPPLRASHAVRGVPGGWITVETDPDANSLLERALATAIRNPMRDDRIEPQMWLDWQRRPPGDNTLLDVHLGDQKVATLDANTTALFGIHMDAAAAKGLLPEIKGRLVRTAEAPGHRLQIQCPAEPTDRVRR
jgi:hypothetical protein